MSEAQIKVLIADDSRVARRLLTHLLGSDPKIHVLGVVDDGQAALEFMHESKPDVIVMDIHMPRLDGFEATRRIMETNPVPIIICTATADAREVANTFRLMEAGAVACIEKPVSPAHPHYQALAEKLIETVKLMSEVKVVRRWPRSRTATSESGLRAAPVTLAGTTPVIGIGASTGGPPVIQTILSGLPKDFSATVLIVQHIAKGFLPGLVEWLNQTTGLQVHIAAHGLSPLPGHVYIAPDGFHMGLTPNGRIFLSQEDPVGGLRPAVAYLFRTLAEVCGARAIGVLLTGMGRDGAAELKGMKNAGAETIAQDRDTSVVHGMPGEAIAMGGATLVLPAEKIADSLVALVRQRLPTQGPKP
jgi:two-component system, chemotaxis family, protein-glutamate methylesterase/glutaminase